jgi:putative FmdB family regulatory protein
MSALGGNGPSAHPEDAKMPTYEYECGQCGLAFERFHSMKDEPVRDCPNEACGGKGTVRRLISSGAGVIFKGSGFYQTDYKGKSPQPKPACPAGEVKGGACPADPSKPACACAGGE